MSELSISQYQSDIVTQKPRMFPAELLRHVHVVNDPSIDKWVATITHGGQKEEFVNRELHKAKTEAAIHLYRAQQKNFSGFGEFSNE